MRLYLDTHTTDPYINLATEEYLLKNSSHNIIMLYQNSESIIIGKHQNAVSEGNIAFSIKNNIPIIRRLSGGGTVYHDTGNLNFSFITTVTTGKQIDFKQYTQPIIDFLTTLGLEAKHSGSNNLTINNYKVSGNAEHIYKNRVLHHGTLLFSSNIARLEQSLRPINSSYNDKSIKSRPWQVTNIQDLLAEKTDITTFKQRLLQFIIEAEHATNNKLSCNETEEIETLAKEKYRTWEWNYGYFSKYIFSKKISFNGSTFDIKITTTKGTISKIDIQTTKENQLLAQTLKNILQGSRHHYYEIIEKLKKSIPSYTQEDIENLVIQMF